MELQDMAVSALAPLAGASSGGGALAADAQPPLGDAPWVKAIPGHVVFDSQGAEPTGDLYAEISADHLFLSLLQNHLLHDMVVIYEAAATTVHTVLRLGVPVCGHPQITHGGLTSAVFDETYGALLFNMRREGQAKFHRVFTARLEVDYLAPLPAESTIVCKAIVESFAGRKLWLTAEVLAAPSASGGDGGSGGSDAAAKGGGGGGARLVYARSRSLFVIPRDDPGLAAEGGGGAAAAANGSS